MALAILSCAVLLFLATSISKASGAVDGPRMELQLLINSNQVEDIYAGGVPIRIFPRSKIMPQEGSLASRLIPKSISQSLMLVRELHVEFLAILKLDAQDQLIAGLQGLDEKVINYFREHASAFSNRSLKILINILRPQSRVVFQRGHHFDVISPEDYVHESFGPIGIPSFESLYLTFQDAVCSFVPSRLEAVRQLSLKQVSKQFMYSTMQPWSIMNAFMASILAPNAHRRDDKAMQVILRKVLQQHELEEFKVVAKQNNWSLLNAVFSDGSDEQVLAVLARLQPLHMSRLRRGSHPQALVHLLNSIFFEGLPWFDSVNALSRLKVVIALLRSLQHNSVGERLHAELLPWVRNAKYCMNLENWEFMLDWVLQAEESTLDIGALIRPAQRFLRNKDVDVEEMLFRMTCYRYFDKYQLNHLPSLPSSIHDHRGWREYLGRATKQLYSKL